MKKVDSLFSRYIYKLSGNIIHMVGSIVTTLLAPRALGPSAYGIFGFITEFFVQVFGSCDSGTSSALFTKISQRQNEFKVISYYWHIVIIINILIFLFVAVVDFMGYSSRLWPDISMNYVYYGFIFASLSFTFQISNKVIDALGYTVSFEKIRAFQVIIKIASILTLVYLNYLNLKIFFIFHFILFLFLIFGIWGVLKSKEVSQVQKISFKEIKSYTKEFWKYSSPLIVYSLFGLIAIVGDRWLLQQFAGSIEQGFFTLAYQLGSICFLFTRAMTPLFHRELAIAFESESIENASRIVETFLPVFYIIAAFLSVFAFFNTKELIDLVAGEKYKASYFTISIMLLYPVHQTYGQLVNSIYYASSETKTLRNIGIIFLSIGLMITFIFLAPTKLMGLDLKSFGLALKTIIIQFITVNTLIYFISKKLKVSFYKIFVHQFLILLIFGIASYLTTEITKEFHMKSIIFVLAIRFIIYFLFAATLSVAFHLMRFDIVLDPAQKNKLNQLLRTKS